MVSANLLEAKRFYAFVLGVLLVSSATLAQQQHPRFERGFNENRLYDLSDLDQVNLFNGNLSISIPIGQSYPLGGDRSFQMKLVYNSKVWDREIDENTGDPYLTYTTSALLNPFENAGIGWSLNLGRLRDPNVPGNESASWIYVSPDGAEHKFGDVLRHDQGPHAAYGFTRDNSYLRIKHASSTLREVHFPDGQVHTFNAAGRLTSMLDPYGNAILSVDYSQTNKWIITDRFRSYEVVFTNFNGRPVLSRVELPTFDNSSDLYTFHYAQDETFEKPLCIHTSSQPSQANVKRLESIQLPNGTSYAFTYNDAGRGHCSNGTLASMRIPTGAISSYAYDEYMFAKPCSGNAQHTGGPPNIADIPRLFSTSLGVARKTLSRGNDVDTWTYEQELAAGVGVGCSAQDNGISSAWEYAKTIVTDPLGHQRHHYFSMWQGSNPSADMTTRSDHALPFMRVTHPDPELNPNPYSNWFLSSEVYDPSFENGEDPVRSTYVKYDNDFDTLGDATSGLTYNVGNFNRREQNRRTVFHDDSHSVVDVIRTNWDGLGHYRTETVSGDFGEGTDERAQTTNYNCSSIHITCAVPGNVPANAAKWLLNTSEFTLTDQGGNDYTKVQTCFNAQGDLTHSRSMRVALPNSADVVTVLERYSGSSDNAGSVSAEKVYGGDHAPGDGISTSTNLCGFSGEPPQLDYHVAHTYSSGVLATSQYQGTPAVCDPNSSGTCSFPKHVDNTIDQSTGLVKRSRDPSKLETIFEYDTSSRVTGVKPSTTHGGAWTNIEYQNHTPGNATSTARALIRQRPNSAPGGTVLAQEDLAYSAMGRLFRRSLHTPDGLARSRTDYDALGQTIGQTVWGFGQSGAKSTRFKNYDPFGRAREIRTPDGLPQFRTYTGNRRVVTTTRIQLPNGASPQTVNKTELFDVLGRLDRVREQVGSSSNSIETIEANYAYDDQDRIRTVVVSGDDGNQTRTFTYDRRGFLESEQHPESALISYGSFDAKGNPGTRSHGGITLSYDYDRAGRLVTVTDEAAPAPKQLKTWIYENDSGAVGAFGKVKDAWRTNHFQLSGAPASSVVRVRQTTEYGGVGGAPSTRTLTDFLGGTGGNATADEGDGLTARSEFLQSWLYNDLGQVATTTYPSCQVGSPFCVSEEVRLVFNGYVDGYLETVDQRLTTQQGGLVGGLVPVVSEMRYLPTGQVSRVVHSNSRQWLQVADRDRMARPGSIKVADTSDIVSVQIASYTGVTVDFNSGPVHHADNVINYTDLVIPSGASLHSVGGESVSLGLGFHAQANSSFTARLADATQITSNEEWNSGDYEYDGAGNISRIGESLYSYDGLQRLVEAKVSVDPALNGATTLDRQYVYDSFGNLHEIIGSNGRNTPTSTDTNRLTVGGAAYDLRGNATNLPVATFSYDSFNMANQIDYSSAGIWTHLYTADDERYYSYHQKDNLVDDEDRWYLRDLDNKVLREIRHTFNNPGGAPDTWVTTDTLYRGSTLLASVKRESLASGEMDELIHYHVDHLGTPRLITASDGAVLDYRAYFPYGEQANFVAGGSGDGSDRMRFTGHERDLGVAGNQGDDLDYMHARYFFAGVWAVFGG